MGNIINVTKTFLPPFEEYTVQLQRAWDSQWLTNRGELVIELESILKKHLGVNDIIVTNNGTVPLQIALKLLGKGGEIITTPFSYVATTAAIVWENCTPVFVDIDPLYLTIDPTKIEAAITDRTTAILATHVFGNPCDIFAIKSIAEKYNIKVIYDAAHCFGVKYQNESIFNYGDISTCSFHATKLFHTGEGGAMFTADESLFHQLYYSHNFGHNGPLAFYGLGINGKMSELQAALGLSIYPYIEDIINTRRSIISYYNNHLRFKKFRALTIRNGTEWNNSYYAIIFETEMLLLHVEQILQNNGIVPRRYFYPSLNTVEFCKGNSMPVSEQTAKTILCLPLYVGLSDAQLGLICSLINAADV